MVGRLTTAVQKKRRQRTEVMTIETTMEVETELASERVAALPVLVAILPLVGTIPETLMMQTATWMVARMVGDMTKINPSTTLASEVEAGEGEVVVGALATPVVEAPPSAGGELIEEEVKPEAAVAEVAEVAAATMKATAMITTIALNIVALPKSFMTARVHRRVIPKLVATTTEARPG
ncbi:hypothetical protein H4S07_006339, partial [Coemansia furcata]